MSKEKREQIIDAAYKVMSAKGYEKASIKDIALEAGITPGLIHYYFRSKEEILMELLMSASKHYTYSMQRLQSSVPPEQLAKAALNEPKERVEQQPEWYQLRYELFALGLREPNISQSVNDLIENARNGISDILQKVFGSSSEETASTAAILIACFDGLAMQKLLNPDFNIERAYSQLEKMLSSLKYTPE
ncbi:TetR/AcrR family transcriptional regulator [Paenibacillus motobuensis]|uniref:TetR/AcrR family transcriptional regulator n=1 Tax=Paenibacillus TaxID=44249 RepID=UPI00203AED94|nr:MULTISPECIES: TetR/AcrR family transcriptional regulator [Paenibacillus]MCM3039376.1 TetR/AcrR family transcriptional regulator [Paenibacillus lutimineralis]MCM3646480.1 TetR/AcrR family transcriptional regulator [Paenibacillus motobuensis]